MSQPQGNTFKDRVLGLDEPYIILLYKGLKVFGTFTFTGIKLKNTQEKKGARDKK